jgi:putative ABC transport system permease protein
MWFSTFVIKNLTRRPLRSLLTVFAIAIAIGAVVSLVGVANGFEYSFLSLYKNIGIDMIVTRAGSARRLDSALDESLEPKIKEIAGVREVLSGLADMVTLETPDGDKTMAVLQGWEAETAVFNHLKILDGRALKKGETVVFEVFGEKIEVEVIAKEAMLGTNLAGKLDKKVGDKIEIIEKEIYTVVGVFESDNVYESGAIVIPIKLLQRMMDRPNKVTGFSLVLEDPHNTAEIDRIKHQVEALAPGLAARTTEEHVKSINEIQVAKTMAWLTSIIALFIGFFGIMNTMVMSVHERMHEIGILRAVGWKVVRVIRMILLESVFLSLVGAVFGMVGGTLLVHLLTRLPRVNGLIEGRIEPYLFGYGLVIALFIGLLASILPALRAAQMLPTEALRHE